MSKVVNGENHERTFQYQDTLPSLPVPDLRKTLAKYLDSVVPHLQRDEYERTKGIVEDFEAGVGQRLQELLLERSKRERNWLEKWWEDNAYHLLRDPILPLVNFGGSSPHYDVWPPNIGSAIPRTALSTYWILRYWDLIRKERLPVHEQRGTKWCMNQVHRLFNTCRIPGETKDELRFSFKTVYEGNCPSHIVVMDRGLFWQVDVLDPTSGELYTPPQLEACFEQIRQFSAVQNAGVPIGALTCLDRTDWFKERQHLISLSPQNARCLDVIERSIIMISFTNDVPSNDNELAFQAVAPDPRTVWADKSYVMYVHKNGLITSNSDHSFAEAMVTNLMQAYVDDRLQENGFCWNGDQKKAPCPHAVQLQFVTTPRVVESIDRAISTWQRHADNFECMIWHSTIMGMEFFKKLRIYGDTIVQLCLQLAYMKLHNRPGATYETATTKKFYHGRTETVRSCTPEAVAMAKAMLDHAENISSRYRKFQMAVQKHNKLMAEAMNGEGCDRHLLGLKLLAQEHLKVVPEIFLDPAWKKSGGDGNFILSTSFIGYTNVWGGVTAMCEDGYGTFYKMQANSITFYLSSWKLSKETNISLWRDSLEYALTAIKKLLEHGPTLVSKY